VTIPELNIQLLLEEFPWCFYLAGALSASKSTEALTSRYSRYNPINNSRPYYEHSHIPSKSLILSHYHSGLSSTLETASSTLGMAPASISASTAIYMMASLSSVSIMRRSDGMLNRMRTFPSTTEFSSRTPSSTWILKGVVTLPTVPSSSSGTRPPVRISYGSSFQSEEKCFCRTSK